MASALGVAAMAVMLLGTPALAVQPDEVLDDPVMEERARDISEGLRCMVCRNESIDESNADLARDMRLLVRERLTEGDSDAQVIEYIVARYGEYALLRPQTDGANLILWISGPVLFLLALGTAVIYLRRRATMPETASATLTDAERARLRELESE
ncbi:cytochrome c-type biogenesis protein [Roseicitreum antarcticum]|uniref:Cytochrome c-type biogenesis protein n=1 Tax=Roseicitreum antarcticum TaxID=564137 RepID=A0A1H2ZWL7_9RHOB|nr:cytochrome c-type biogenesis protein [Roseicitreum antarcticum]SDX21717.1 cytochrome c-type biogenesis protein CcmH [Roseicitreum antarcticum]